MKVTLKFDYENGSYGVCLVEKEKEDIKYRDSEWGSGESRLLYHIKKKLNEMGYDFIKKRMWKDGHLMDDQQQYLRSRKRNKNAIGIYNGSYSIDDAGEVFNKEGMFILTVSNIG